MPFPTEQMQMENLSLIRQVTASDVEHELKTRLDFLESKYLAQQQQIEELRVDNLKLKTGGKDRSGFRWTE